MPDITNPECKALICCGGEDFFENYSSAGPDEDLFFNEEVSYTSECPPNYNCIPATVTIPANANRPARNKTPDHPAAPAEPPGPAPCFGPFTGATQAEANAAALQCAQDAANSQTVITGPIIFYNTEQTVTCPEGYAGGPFTVPANTTASIVSQAAANAQALAMAQALADAGCVPITGCDCISPDGRTIVSSGPSAACAAPASGAALEDYIFVCNESTTTVSVIDASTDEEIAQIPGFTAPRNLIYSPSNNRVYVNDSSGIIIIDPTTLGLDGTVTLPAPVTAAELSQRHFCLDAVNNKLYIPSSEDASSDGRIISIDVGTDTSSILVSLPLGTPAVDSYEFSLRVAHSFISDLIYVWFAYNDLVTPANSEVRIRVYDTTGVQVDEIVILDGAYSSAGVMMYYFTGPNKVYQTGLGGASGDDTFKTIDPDTNTVVSTHDGLGLASLDFNVQENSLVLHGPQASSNVLIFEGTSSTLLCTRTVVGGTIAEGLGQPATIDGRTWVPRATKDDCVILSCTGCQFENTEQTVECPMGETGGPFVVSAGTYTSCVSVADANDMAMADGQALADAECMACTDHPVQDLVWTLTGNACGSTTAAGGSASFNVPTAGGAGVCTASATLEGSCNEYILDIEVTAYSVATTSVLDGPSAASFVRIRVDAVTEFNAGLNPPAGPPGCTTVSGGPNSVQHTIQAGTGTHDIELIVQNGSVPFPPGPCSCTATFSLTPLTPP